MESVYFAEPAISAVEKEITALEDKEKEDLPLKKSKQANPYIIMVILTSLILGGILLITASGV